MNIKMLLFATLALVPLFDLQSAARGGGARGGGAHAGGARSAAGPRGMGNRGGSVHHAPNSRARGNVARVNRVQHVGLANPRARASINNNQFAGNHALFTPSSNAHYAGAFKAGAVGTAAAVGVAGLQGQNRTALQKNLSPFNTAGSGRFAEQRSAQRLAEQRGFLNRNYNGHDWNWWWQNDQNSFYSYFPDAFYDDYGYYPPIYYDYYDANGAYPNAVPSDVQPEGYDVTAVPCNRTCIQDCLNSSSLSAEQCTESCNEYCAQQYTASAA